MICKYQYVYLPTLYIRVCVCFCVCNGSRYCIMYINIFVPLYFLAFITNRQIYWKVLYRIWPICDNDARLLIISALGKKVIFLTFYPTFKYPSSSIYVPYTNIRVVQNLLSINIFLEVSPASLLLQFADNNSHKIGKF